MVIAPDLAVATEHELSHLRGSLETRLEKDKIATKSLAVTNGAIELELADPAQAQALRDAAGRGLRRAAVARSWRRGACASRSPPAWQREVRERAMLQALEVIRRRVDDPATGIQESVVTRQGDSRILVQIPGVSVVPDIFKQTGFLEFKIVRESEGTENAEQLLRARHPGGLPEGTEILFEKDRKTDKVLVGLPGARGPRHHRRLPRGRARPVRLAALRVAGGLHLERRRRPRVRRADRQERRASRSP